MGAAPGTARGGYAVVAPGLGSVTLNVDLNSEAVRWLHASSSFLKDGFVLLFKSCSLNPT